MLSGSSHKGLSFEGGRWKWAEECTARKITILKGEIEEQQNYAKCYQPLLRVEAFLGQQGDILQTKLS